MQAHAAATSSSQETEASHDDWFRRILAQDAARVDALLGLLISMMADAEAKGEVCEHQACHGKTMHSVFRIREASLLHIRQHELHCNKVALN